MLGFATSDCKGPGDAVQSGDTVDDSAKEPVWDSAGIYAHPYDDDVGYDTGHTHKNSAQDNEAIVLAEGERELNQQDWGEAGK